MDLILAGNWHSDIHEGPMSVALQKLNCNVHSFKWHKYFIQAEHKSKLISFIVRLQRRLAIGPLVNKLNRDLVALVKDIQPEVLFIYRGDMIRKQTLIKIRKISPNTILVAYNNDDPFSPFYPGWFWRHFINSIPEYDLVLAYREQNIEEFKLAGAKRVELLRSWFVPEKNYPVAANKDYKYDVVFIGHYEDDGRKEMLEAVVSEGYSLGLYGHGKEWNLKIKDSEFLKNQMPVRPVWGEEYNQLLNQGRVALCFFSKLNRDTYTRRCFEIPASKTVMLSQYSDDLASMFKPDYEAVYFKNKNEMLDKLKWIISDQETCMKISQAGYKKVWDAGHDVVSRMKNVITWVMEIKQAKLDNIATSHN